MVSLQAANNNWLAYGNEEQLPAAQDYIGTYRMVSPSYQNELTLTESHVPDHQVLETLANYDNSFSELYQSYPKAFSATDQYTLFLPLTSSLTDTLLASQRKSSQGFSHKDKKYAVEAATQLQNLLERHMVDSVIRPNQLEYRTTRVRTRGKEVFEINQYGHINHDETNKIVQSVSLPHATIFLIQKEITTPSW
jgi:hypothetical protein